MGNVCNDPTDQYANIVFFRDPRVIDSTGPFPISNLGYQMGVVRGAFGVAYVITSGPNGDTVYRGSGYDDYIANGGTPPATTPPGQVSDSGVISCDVTTPPPCPTGSHWDLDSNQCVPDVPAPPGGSEPPPGDNGGNSGGGGSSGGGGGGIPIIIPIPPDAPPDGDDSTDCCALTAKYLYYVAKSLAQLAAQGEGDNGACCAAIVAAITAIATTAATSLESIRGAVGHADYDSVYNTSRLIVAISDGFKSIPTPAPIDLSTVVEALQQIAAAEPGLDPNVKRIADDMDILVSDADPDGDAYVDFLVNGGALDPSFGTIIKAQT